MRLENGCAIDASTRAGHEASSTIEVDVRARRGSKPHCSCCGTAAPGYDVLPMRRFEFIPIWGYVVMLLYAMRRVQCRQCGVKVEQVPWRWANTV